jgi:hypothetical protein
MVLESNTSDIANFSKAAISSSDNSSFSSLSAWSTKRISIYVGWSSVFSASIVIYSFELKSNNLFANLYLS